ncbi:hypothetical protein PR048_023569 [Dryococelus australis]|uniref:Uncharacterized protein n=1 Tax=Dryococelus australis TaxID=614101 RepID=A0ABQ9GUG1_9NEOP|nr:hypothetical protein PR048_023569 [Dryococelus australis]
MQVKRLFLQQLLIEQAKYRTNSSDGPAMARHNSNSNIVAFHASLNNFVYKYISSKRINFSLSDTCQTKSDVLKLNLYSQKVYQKYPGSIIMVHIQRKAHSTDKRKYMRINKPQNLKHKKLQISGSDSDDCAEQAVPEMAVNVAAKNAAEFIVSLRLAEKEQEYLKIAMRRGQNINGLQHRLLVLLEMMVNILVLPPD